MRIFIFLIVFCFSINVLSREILPELPKTLDELDAPREFFEAEQEKKEKMDIRKITEKLKEMEVICQDCPFALFSVAADLVWCANRATRYLEWSRENPETKKQETPPEIKEFAETCLRIFQKVIDYEDHGDPFWGTYQFHPYRQVEALRAQLNICNRIPELKKEWKKKRRQNVEMYFRRLADLKEMFSDKRKQEVKAKIQKWKDYYKDYDPFKVVVIEKTPFTPVMEDGTVLPPHGRLHRDYFPSEAEYWKWREWLELDQWIYCYESCLQLCEREYSQRHYEASLYVSNAYLDSPAEMKILKKLYKKYDVDEETQKLIWEEMQWVKQMIDERIQKEKKAKASK